jgi:hypothetical protein
MPLQKSRCFGDRLRANSRVVHHGVAGRFCHARAERVGIEGLHLAID